MFELLVSDSLRFSHLLAIAVGFGVAIETEIFMLRRRRTLISPGLLSGIEHRHRVILFALAAMWATGTALIALRTGFQLSAFTPKLWAKLSVVAILTINAVFISKIAMPILADYRGQRISNLPAPARRALFAVAGISAASWLIAMLLGASAALKVAPAPVFQSLLPVAYCVGVLVANLVGERLYAPAPVPRQAQASVKPTSPKAVPPAPPRAAVARPAAAKAAAMQVAAQPQPLASPPPTAAAPKPAATSKRHPASKVELRVSDLAIAFPQKLKRKPRLKADPKVTDAQSQARQRLAEVAAELQARGSAR